MPHLEDDRVKTETQRDLLCSVHRVNDNFWVIWPFIGLIYPSEPLDLASPAKERICIKVIYCLSETYLAFL